MCVNPHRAGNDAARLHAAREAYHRTHGPGQAVPRAEPHVGQLAIDAYYNMCRTGQDQSIVVSGEAGAGKSESRRQAVKAIVDLSVSAPGKKGGRLASQIVNAEVRSVVARMEMC